jgi:ADP-ribose pyrophosphatase YjhB (NUDIX family)
VREETGLDVIGLRQVGVMLFEHRTPKPKDYRYPYPHFMQVVFATSSANGAKLVCNDEWAAVAEFVDEASARAVVPLGQASLLDAALGLMHH